MVKGGKVSSKRRVKPRSRSDYKGSDDSDEDYVISDEEKIGSEDLEEDYCSSLDGNASVESFGSYEEGEEEVKWARKNSRSRAKKGVAEFIVEGEGEDEDEEEEEDEEEMKKVRNNGRSRVKKGRFVVDEEEEEYEPEEEEEEDEEIKKVRKKGRSRAKNGRCVVDEEEDEYEPEEEEDEEMKNVRNNGASRVKKGKDRFIMDEEDDELEEDEDEDEDEDEEEVEDEEEEVGKVARSKSQNGSSARQKYEANPSQKRRTALEEMADRDYVDEEDDDNDYDEEFTPDEDDFSELEEESRVKKKKTSVKVARRRLKKKGPVRRKSKKPLKKKQKKNRTLRRKVRSDDDDDDDDDDDFMDSNLHREKNEKKRPKKRRRIVVPSDSDFVSSGSSDCDYTISEEEREQVREAMRLCGSLEPNFRSSSPSENIQKNEIVQQPRKPPGRKGKEKIEQVKVEVVKQVCGICLSEEDKRRVRGTLDCCTHYFCFSCIMEWGKVESRCPLCKQRFKTISKPTRAGTDLREVVMTVPERDQVYQPTEEELRSYLDPYENVICTECHEGGDDELMLLCDVCDSPAHTYCVGLGRVVPDGNWYCEGCRPVALGSSSSQVQGWFTEQRTTNILPNRQSPAISFGEGLEIDLNSVSSPRSYISQGFGNSSPWFHVGGFQAASPGSGAGTPTLSGRRFRHRQIHQLISANRMSHLASRNERNSSTNLSTDNLNAQTAQGRETRAEGTERSFHTFFEERSQENPSLQVQDNDIFSSTSNHQRRQLFQDPTAASTDRRSSGTLWPVPTEDTISAHVQTHHFSTGPNIGSDGASHNTDMARGDIIRAKEQLQSLVISHLKRLSQDRDLGQSTTTFQEIARSAMHTVLAACELEHTGSEVLPVPPPSPCPHIELMAGKTSLMRGCCSSCFTLFVEDIVKRVMEYKLPSWLRLAL